LSELRIKHKPFNSEIKENTQNERRLSSNSTKAVGYKNNNTVLNEYFGKLGFFHGSDPPVSRYPADFISRDTGLPLSVPRECKREASLAEKTGKGFSYRKQEFDGDYIFPQNDTDGQKKMMRDLSSLSFEDGQ
jgi:hypothetical protein